LDFGESFLITCNCARRSNMVPRLPGAAVIRPGAQFSYPRYCDSTYPDSPYSDKKYAVCRRSVTWKCVALMLLFTVVALIAVVAYLLGTCRRSYSSFHLRCLHWKL